MHAQANAINTAPLKALIIGMAVLSMSFAPFMAEAASKKSPTCELTVTTDAGKTKITDEGEVVATAGEDITISWKAKNATSAEGPDGDKIKTSGKDTFEIDGEETYDFTFKNGSKEVTCSVTVGTGDATIDSKSLSKGSEKPTITGTAEGLKKVRVAIYKEGSSKPVFEKKSVSVKKDKWTVKVSKKLAKGDYDVRLYADKSKEVLDEETLSVGSSKNDDDDKDSDEKSDGTLSVSMIPLGIGGSASAGKPFSATLIEVRNTGKEDVALEGFEVRQTGSLSASSIVSLSTIDNKGETSATKSASWKNGVALAPSSAVIPAGGVKLFTVKATLDTSATKGSTVVLDIISVKSNGKSVKGSLPIKGTFFNVI